MMRHFMLVLCGCLVVGCADLGADFDHGSNAMSLAEMEEVEKGREAFEERTFGGNGRTCSSCHRAITRTVSPEIAQQLFAANPDDPLFQHDAADGFGRDEPTEVCTQVKSDAACKVKKKGVRCRVKVIAGLTYECETSFKRFLAHATITVGVDLHPNVSIAGSSARRVLLNRGVPTSLNTPALDPVLMYDGREPTLQSQAAGAFEGHAQIPDVSDDVLDAVAEFERTEFSSDEVAEFADGGEAPLLPPGTTESEKRGRIFFLPPHESYHDPTTPNAKEGFCGVCHSGPMLDEMGLTFNLPVVNDEVNITANEGERFNTALVSEVNSMGNPEYLWVLTDDEGNVRTITSPDIGRAAITGKWADVEEFKIPTLWGASDTAPYFHDNSAKTIREMVDHYADFVAPTFGLVLTEQDRADVANYMRLL